MKNTVSKRVLSKTWQLVAAAAMLIVLVLAVSQKQAAGQTPAQEPDGLARLAADSGGTAQIRLNKATGVAGFVRLAPDSAPLPLAGAASPETAAGAFFQRYGDVFGIVEPDSELLLIDSSTISVAGGQQLTYQQIYEDLPVFAAVLKARVNARNQISSVNGTFVPHIKLRSTTPTLSAQEAQQIAVAAVAAQNETNGTWSRLPKQQDSSTGQNATRDLTAVHNELLVFRSGLVQGVPGRDHLAYEVEVANASQSIREFVYVDAHSGAVVDQITGILHGLNREISEGDLANVIWKEGDAYPLPNGWAGGTAQQVEDWQNEVDGAAETYNLFSSMAKRDSYDGAGAKMRTVNNDPGINCPNALWNGTSTNYCSGVTGDDTVAHEWGHAYTEFTNNLVYQWQSGALNESYSDIWGDVVDLLNGRGEDTPDVVRQANYCSSHPDGANFPGNPTVNTVRWLSGEDDPGFGGAIRDMWDPTCFGDPGKVSDDEYWCSTDDSGGVHINSGVPNHAFALLVDGGTYNNQTVGAIGLTKASHIHWGAQMMLTPASNFADHADALEAACSALVGIDLPALSTSVADAGLSGEKISAADCQEVAKAIAAVEFHSEPSQCDFGPLLDPDAPALCENSGTKQSIALEDWESGSLPAGWSVGTHSVANPASFDTPDWDVVSSLPSGAKGSYAAFVPDLLEGDCDADDESGVLYLDSPAITIPNGAIPRAAFDHWVATEAGWDGGNLKVSVNDGPWTLVSSDRFEFNGYNSTLETFDSGNTNPLAGELAFSGSDGGQIGGSWGQSQVNLIGLAGAGDTIRLRFEFGIDGCNGLVGWYVDDVELYACTDEEPPPCGDSILDLGESCDDGNNTGGDGCSTTCQVEDGWTCKDPVPPVSGTNVIEDGSFEAGYNAGIWDEYSLNFGTPICDASCSFSNLASDGQFWTWFGGIDIYEEGSVAQTVRIPTSATDLTFDLVVPVCDSKDDYMELLVDDKQEFLADGSSELCDGNEYTEQSVDLSAYADGGLHTVEFHSETFASNNSNSNFFLDKVFLSDNVPLGGQPSICTSDGSPRFFIWLPTSLGSPAG